MRTLLVAISTALLSQVALASPPDFPILRKPAASTQVADPCGSQPNGPRPDLGRQALVNNCKQLHMKLQASPEDADLQARCDQAARALTGRVCGATPIHRPAG